MSRTHDKRGFGPRFGHASGRSAVAGLAGLAGLVGLACSSGSQSSATGSGGAGPDGGAASGGSSGAGTGGAPSTSSGGAPSTSSGGAPSASSGGAPSTSSGGAPSKSSGGASGGSSGSGGSNGSGGSGTSASGGAPGSGGGAGQTAPTCDLAPAPRRSTGTVVEVAVDPVFGDAPFVYGETNTLPDGSQVVPLNFRFYVSAFELTTKSGASVPVDLVDAAGAPAAYGVHLYNGEDDASHTFRVLAPAGDYTGARFTLGLPGECNGGFASGRQPPLDDSSQLSWPHGFGYLFLRYEGRIDTAGTAQPPGAIHMGGDLLHLTMPGAPVISLEGALAVPASGTLRKKIRLYVDQIFKGATTDVQLSAYFMTAPAEMKNGERLRLNASGLKLSDLAP